eukprot:721789-Prorocentrum_lima.AAC.1
MTSSLVGSEMCIRDRSKRRGITCGHGRSHHAILRSTFLKGKSQAEQEGCLLYTSDAADDM